MSFNNATYASSFEGMGAYNECFLDSLETGLNLSRQEPFLLRSLGRTLVTDKTRHSCQSTDACMHSLQLLSNDASPIVPRLVPPRRVLPRWT